jgi:transposase
MDVVGCEVSKKRLDCALLLSSEPLKLRSKALVNHQPGCLALIEWACRQARCAVAQLHVVMEATGVYHEAAAYALTQAGVKVSVVNPARVREFARSLAVRTKTDASDSVILARYGASIKPPLWQPPAPEIVELKALLSRLQAVETDLQREANRLEKAQISLTPQTVLDSLHKSLAFLRQEKAALEQRIDDHIEGHPQLKHDRGLLESIPAIGRKTAPAHVVRAAFARFPQSQCCRRLSGIDSRPTRIGQLGASSPPSVQGGGRLHAGCPLHGGGGRYPP